MTDEPVVDTKTTDSFYIVKKNFSNLIPAVTWENERNPRYEN